MGGMHSRPTRVSPPPPPIDIVCMDPKTVVELAPFFGRRHHVRHRQGVPYGLDYLSIEHEGQCVRLWASRLTPAADAANAQRPQVFVLSGAAHKMDFDRSRVAQVKPARVRFLVLRNQEYASSRGLQCVFR